MSGSRTPETDDEEIRATTPLRDDATPLPSADGTAEVVLFDPEQAADITQEIRAVAEARAGEDTGPMPLVEPPTDSPRPATEPPAGDEPLTVEELRDAWGVLDSNERLDGLRLLPREDAEEFFISAHAMDQTDVVLAMRPGEQRAWMRLLEPDDVADVIQAAPEDQRARLLSLVDRLTRKEVEALLAYEEDEAGGLMNTRYARLRPQATVDEALSYLRRQARTTTETIYYVYVLDAEQKLVGVVSFRDLFASPGTARIEEIMRRDVVMAAPDTDQEALSRLFVDHDLPIIPIVDDQGVMKGIVTVDDIVDVVQEEATEDAQKFGGMAALEEPYLQASVVENFKKRGVWLTVLMFGQMLTTTVIGIFARQIEAAVVLAMFMPLVISSGGNSGSQASTLVIRAMALGEVRPADLLRVVRRELVTGLALGGLLGVLGVLRIVLWPNAASAYTEFYVRVAFTIGFSLVGVVMFGTLAGSTLPFLLRRFGADPASASAPFVATLCDVTGLLIYFTIANIMLTGALL
jgi:magnesium transporter